MFNAPEMSDTPILTKIHLHIQKFESCLFPDLKDGVEAKVNTSFCLPLKGGLLAAGGMGRYQPDTWTPTYNIKLKVAYANQRHRRFRSMLRNCRLGAVGQAHTMGHIYTPAMLTKLLRLRMVV